MFMQPDWVWVCDEKEQTLHSQEAKNNWQSDDLPQINSQMDGNCLNRTYINSVEDTKEPSQEFFQPDMSQEFLKNKKKEELTIDHQVCQVSIVS